MSEIKPLARYIERPPAFEAFVWDGSLDGADVILKSTPGSRLFRVSGRSTIELPGGRIGLPDWTFLRRAGQEAFTIALAPADMEAEYMPEPSGRALIKSISEACSRDRVGIIGGRGVAL